MPTCARSDASARRPTTTPKTENKLMGNMRRDKGARSDSFEPDPRGARNERARGLIVDRADRGASSVRGRIAGCLRRFNGVLATVFAAGGLTLGLGAALPVAHAAGTAGVDTQQAQQAQQAATSGQRGIVIQVAQADTQGA